MSFRNLEDETTAAISLFGNKDAGGIVMLKPYAEYFAEYVEKVAELRDIYPNPAEPLPVGETAQKAFVNAFSAVLRLRNILLSFDDFTDADVLSQATVQDYSGRYQDLHDYYRSQTTDERESILNDVVFEIELIKQVEVNVDYILMLVEERRKATGQGEDKEIRAKISRSVDSSPTLRSKKDLIEQFVDSISLDAAVRDEWQAYIAAKKEEELVAIIAEERLVEDETRAFIDAAFRNGEVRETGTAVVKILPAVSMFNRGGSGSRAEQKNRVLSKLKEFVERFSGMGVTAE